MGRTALIMVFAFIITTGIIFTSLMSSQEKAIDKIVQDTYLKHAKHIANTFAHESLVNFRNHYVNDINHKVLMGYTYDLTTNTYGTELVNLDNKNHMVIMTLNKEDDVLDIAGSKAKVIVNKENYIPYCTITDKFLTSEARTLIEGEFAVTSFGTIDTPDGTNYKAVTQIVYKRIPFSEYVLFIDEFTEDLAFGPGENFQGPVHSNSYFRVTGTATTSSYNGPTFEDIVTAHNFINFGFKNNSPRVINSGIRVRNSFSMGFNEKVPKINLPATNQNLGLPNNASTAYNLDTNGNYQIIILDHDKIKLYKRNHNQEIHANYVGNYNAKKDEKIINLSDLSNYGMILYSGNNDLIVHGKLHEDYPLTIATEKRIWLHGDISYSRKTNGQPYPLNHFYNFNNYKDMKSMLGLIAGGDIIVGPHNDNKKHLTIMANLISTNGRLVVPQQGNSNFNYWGGLYNLTIVGSRTQKDLQATWSGNRGFKEVFVYDKRFKFNNPPGTPLTNYSARITLWEELPVMIKNTNLLSSN